MCINLILSPISVVLTPNLSSYPKNLATENDGLCLEDKEAVGRLAQNLPPCEAMKCAFNAPSTAEDAAEHHQMSAKLK